ncbi:hypothetical protein [Legionella sp. km772]|uniref:hypothetical protein n=1 Tax=Legionella sp. km772 TaxID=2498111 RepID=UPI000F8C51D7|nr:hypothetical protein [Legionella sp. km772]RUR10402.1 hypothetical protein ELY15_08180 [Legionella sp. km772]
MKPHSLKELFDKATRSVRFYSLDDLERTPSLHARATAIKEQLHARKSIREREQQNKEEYLAFLDLFDKDPVFRFKVTQQYHLLRALFEDPHLKAQWQAFLDDVEQADKNKKRVINEWTEYAQAKTQELHNQSLAQANNSSFQWTHPKTHASEMEQWAHYERELQRVSFNYHQERAAVHLKAANAHINHLDGVIEHLRNQANENTDLIQHLENQRERAHARREHLLNAKPHHSKHPHSLVAMQKYEQECQSLKKDIQAVLHELHHHPKAQSKEIAIILHKHDESVQQEQEELRQLDKAYEEQSKILIAQIETKKAAAIAKLVEKIDNSIIKLVHAQGGVKLSAEDRIAFEQSVASLERLKTALQGNQDFASVQAIENELHKELHQINYLLSEKVMAPLHHEIMEQEAEYQSDELELSKPSTPEIEQNSESNPSPLIPSTSPALEQSVVSPSPIIPLVSTQQQLREHLQDLRMEKPVGRALSDIGQTITSLSQSGKMAAEAQGPIEEIQKITLKIRGLSEKDDVSLEFLEELNDKLSELVVIHPEFTKIQKKLNEIIDEQELELPPISNRS